MPTHPFELTRLRAALKPYRLHWFPSLRSTSDHAAALRARGELFAPAVVLTGRQTAGRGRGTNTWWSGPGCLTATLALPIDERVAPHQLPLVAGLAVRDAAAALTGSDALKLKWPNDLLLDDRGSLRKVAGLLCERVNGVDLVGLGLNVNMDPQGAPPALRDRVSSLARAAGKPLDMTDVLAAVARQLHEATARHADRPFAAVLRAYDAHHALVGRTVTIVQGTEPPVTGRCEGLDDTGRLLLRSRTALHRIVAGQVVLEPTDTRTHR